MLMKKLRYLCWNPFRMVLGDNGEVHIAGKMPLWFTVTETSIMY